MYPSNHREHARTALSGHWGIAILVCLVAGLLGGGGSSGTVNLNFQLSHGLSDPLYMLPPEVYGVLLTMITFFAVFTVIISVVYLVIGGAVELGCARFHLNLIDGRNASFSDLFSQFSRLGSAVVMYILRGLFTLLWTTLLIVPGIIAIYSYAMAPYIMLEDPNCGGYEALKRSKQMMKGHKMDLFLLGLSFIGWHLLCVLTLGIGYLWLTPYINAARASFYRGLTTPEGQAQSYTTTVEF